MFPLSSVAALDVAERRVGIHYAHVGQVLQTHQILGLAGTVKPATTESKRTKMLIDDV